MNEFKAIARCYDFSCKVFTRYKIAFKKANKFTNDIGQTCNIDDRIYCNNGATGEYCIVNVEINKDITLDVNLNVESGDNRIDSSIKIEDLKEQYGNYCDYKTLVETVKSIIKKYKE